jgi:hypothetical protein
MLQCRKCGGPHITIKCGRLENNNIEKTKENNNIEKLKENNIDKVRDNTNYQRNYNRRKNTFTIKISNLPQDMKETEMMELTYDWGHIVNVKVLNYEDNSVAYINFEFLEEAKYFIKALDKTPFEYMILDVKLV